MTLTQLYFFTVILPNAAIAVNGLAVALGFLAFACLAIGGMISAGAENLSALKQSIGYAIKCGIASVVICLLAIPLPSDRQLYLLAGGYVATNTKDVSKLPDNVVKAANAWLEKAATLANDKSSTKTK